MHSHFRRHFMLLCGISDYYPERGNRLRAQSTAINFSAAFTLNLWTLHHNEARHIRLPVAILDRSLVNGMSNANTLSAPYGRWMTKCCEHWTMSRGAHRRLQWHPAIVLWHEDITSIVAFSSVPVVLIVNACCWEYLMWLWCLIFALLWNLRRGKPEIRALVRADEPIYTCYSTRMVG